MMDNPITARDNRPVSDLLENDLFLFLEQSEESFDCLVLKADFGSEGNETDSFEEVGTLEHREEKLSYSGYIKTKAVELPGDSESRSIVAMGGFSDGETDGTTFVFEDTQVPEQSLVVIKDIVGKDDDEQTITTIYFVIKILPIGKHGTAGKKHILIPFRGSFEDLLDTNGDNEFQPEEVGELGGFVAVE